MHNSEPQREGKLAAIVYSDNLTTESTQRTFSRTSFKSTARQQCLWLSTEGDPAGTTYPAYVLFPNCPRLFLYSKQPSQPQNLLIAWRFPHDTHPIHRSNVSRASFTALKKLVLHLRS
jgi:hypothetical protein